MTWWQWLLTVAGAGLVVMVIGLALAVRALLRTVRDLASGLADLRTQTLPLAIYSQLEDLDVALAIGGELVIFSFALLLAAKVLPSWRRVSFTSPWTSRGEVSGSTSSLP